MIIGYARVSATDQDPDLQLDALARAKCERIYQEKLSGKARDRPELTACLRSLRRGDVLVVWRMDRLAWSLRDLVEILADLNVRDVGFKSISEAIDTTAAAGKLTFQIFGALSQFEHNLIRERTLVGLAAARARGRRGGRKPSMSISDTRKAQGMLADPAVTKTEVAKHFGVSRVTLNAALARGSDARSETAGH